MNSIKKLFHLKSDNKNKLIYFLEEGSIHDVDLLGRKGANLCALAKLKKVNVPEGFILTSETCKAYVHNIEKKQAESIEECHTAIRELEKRTGKYFGLIRSREGVDLAPLLLGVRMSVAVNMTGMSTTILNIGLNDEIVEHMARLSNDEKWAVDCYRRFIQNYGVAVLHVDKDRYEAIKASLMTASGYKHEGFFTAKDVRSLVEQFKQITAFPQSVWEQLDQSIKAVYGAWSSAPHYKSYRDLHNIDVDIGVALLIQSMVYGNKNVHSGAGVICTRDPNSGARELFGEYITAAGGEDISLGVRTPMSLADFQRECAVSYETIVGVAQTLERKLKDMVTVEFTVEDDTVYVVQVYVGKRSPSAAVRIAVDMVEEQLVTHREALMKLDARHMDYHTKTTINPTNDLTRHSVIKDRIIATGLQASGGAAVGRLVFTAEEVLECRAKGEACILFKRDASAKDIVLLMESLSGVITHHGGMTSHAAVLMRQWSIPAVFGCRALHYEAEGNQLVSSTAGVLANRGDIVTIDGSLGTVYLGELHTEPVGVSASLKAVLKWADAHRQLEIQALVRNQCDLRKAMQFGSRHNNHDSHHHHIGLFTTEHMFLAPESQKFFYLFLLSECPKERMQYLTLLLPVHQRLFQNAFVLLQKGSVTVQLLDKPLIDFFPREDSENYLDELAEIAAVLDISIFALEKRVDELKTSDPTLSCGGAKLNLVHPEVILMQIEAMKDAVQYLKMNSISLSLRVVLPNVFTSHEVDAFAPLLDDSFISLASSHTTVTGGAALDSVRACLKADKISLGAITFVNIDTDKLTESFFGATETTCNALEPYYEERMVLGDNPFEVLDRDLRSLVDMTVRICRKTSKHMKVNVCGAHCGDPSTVKFLSDLRVDCLVCPPDRIPCAVIAAAQAHIRATGHYGPRTHHGQFVEDEEDVTAPGESSKKQHKRFLI